MFLARRISLSIRIARHLTRFLRYQLAWIGSLALLAALAAPAVAQRVQFPTPVQPQAAAGAPLVSPSSVAPPVYPAPNTFSTVPPTLNAPAADGTHVQQFNDARSGPWNPLPRAESGTQGAAVTGGATPSDTPSYAIAALAAIGIVVLLLRRRAQQAGVS